MFYLWFLTTFIALVLTIILINKASKHFAWHYLPWIVAFASFSFCSFASWTSYLTGWTPWLYKGWYVAGAVLVALMGLGQMLFLKLNKWSILFSVYIGLLFIWFVWSILHAPVDHQLLTRQGEIGGSALPRDVRLFSPLFTIPGSLALIGGAFYSALRHKSKEGWLIGLGALILASGGTLVRFDIQLALPIANLIGITMIFLGTNTSSLSSRSLSATNA
ncbi:hypothetical protein GCM10010965_11860 [Caldalkalibacillus thermarum]|uniref:hypothetical protein n=1 Tax=Caldalkalibacillus thermarum TaxID=296745 RepID=UPI00166D94C1|nr:hypothetical protein [Caldalkalibacillus thermarum]GGK20462.1 hypothetical protein GCM10010965_11860 [Caldalkalibacillus thermarum]